MADAPDLGSGGFTVRVRVPPFALKQMGKNARVTQLVESLPSKQMVAGSSPVSRSEKRPVFTGLFFVG